MRANSFTLVVLSMLFWVGCSDDQGAQTLTFVGVGAPGLTLDAGASVGIPDVSVDDVASPWDAHEEDSASDTTVTEDGLVIDAHVEDTPDPNDAGPQDASPGDTTTDVATDTSAECVEDADCFEVVPVGPCTQPKCSATGLCEAVPAPDGSPCDDGDGCTHSEVCSAGQCGGTAVDCESNDPCVVMGCETDLGCVVVAPQDNVPCDDANPCTQGDLCKGGVCSGIQVCECETNAECPDDGNLCNGTAVCQDNACVIDPSTVVECAAGSQCLNMTCNPDSGTCEPTPLDGNDCDAGNCFQGGTCQAGACLAEAVVCEDANACTTDTCNAQSGQCTFMGLTGDPCDDGEVCTLVDLCQDGSCQGGAVDLCNDGNACSVDSCQPGQGCTATALDCDDGNSCTTDACDVATGCVNTAVNCDDGSACTNDTCDPASGCVNAATNCDDANECTTDTCNDATGCAYTNVDCDDGNLCTLEKCNELNGCVFEGVVCNDGSACTTDSCAPATGCVYTDLVCPDPGQCKSSSCDPTTGQCVETPIGPQLGCDDGDPCTNFDQCIDGDCAGAQLICDDQNECTADSCSDGLCQFEALEGLSCDEADPCTAGVCSGSVCSVLDPCDDGDDCTLDSCNAQGACSYVPNPACVDPQCQGKLAGAACDDGTGGTTADMCILGQCAGFAAESHATDVNFGNLSFDKLSTEQGEWTTAASAFGAIFEVGVLIDVTEPADPFVHENTVINGSAFSGLHGRFAATDDGVLWEYDAPDGTWSDESEFSDALDESGEGQPRSLWSYVSNSGTELWVVGSDGIDPYIRYCTSGFCAPQFLDGAGFGNNILLPRAVAGYENCADGECHATLAMGVDSPMGNGFVSHAFDSKSGVEDVWPNGFNDGGASQDQTRDAAAYGDGRFLVVGDDGYMRYRNFGGWENVINTLPGDEWTRVFTGVWIGAGVVIVSATIPSDWGAITLELWTCPAEANPVNAAAWTIFTVGVVYGDQAGLFDVWGLEDGNVRAVGSGKEQAWNAWQKGFIFSRNGN